MIVSALVSLVQSRYNTHIRFSENSIRSELRPSDQIPIALEFPAADPVHWGQGLDGSGVMLGKNWERRRARPFVCDPLRNLRYMHHQKLNIKVYQVEIPTVTKSL